MTSVPQQLFIVVSLLIHLLGLDSFPDSNKLIILTKAKVKNMTNINFHFQTNAEICFLLIKLCFSFIVEVTWTLMINGICVVIASWQLHHNLVLAWFHLWDQASKWKERVFHTELPYHLFKVQGMGLFVFISLVDSFRSLVQYSKMNTGKNRSSVSVHCNIE